MAKWVYADAAIRSLEGLRKKLSDGELAGCLSKSINRCLKDGVMEARAAVAETYNIPSRYLTQIKAVRANKGGFEGNIVASKNPLPLELFKPIFQKQASGNRKAKRAPRKHKGVGKPKKRPIPKGLGVSIEVHKGRRKNIPYAFMLPGYSRKVFARGRYKLYGFSRRKKRDKKNGSDRDISPLITMTVNAAMGYYKNMARLKRVARANLPKYLKEEVQAKIKKLKEED